MFHFHQLHFILWYFDSSEGQKLSMGKFFPRQKQFERLEYKSKVSVLLILIITGQRQTTMGKMKYLLLRHSIKQHNVFYMTLMEMTSTFLRVSQSNSPNLQIALQQKYLLFQQRSIFFFFQDDIKKKKQRSFNICYF